MDPIEWGYVSFKEFIIKIKHSWIGKYTRPVHHGDPSFWFTSIIHPTTSHFSTQKLRMCWTFPPVSLLRLLEHLAMAIFGFWVQAPLTWAPGLKNSPDFFSLQKSGFSVIRLELRQGEILHIPSRELTYPTWGKGKSSSKCHFWGIC